MQTLDREQYPEFDIILRTRDQGTPALTSTATIHLNVSDVNDNAPVFYPVHYYVRVAESEPTHTSVLQVKLFCCDIFYFLIYLFGLLMDVICLGFWPRSIPSLERDVC